MQEKAFYNYKDLEEYFRVGEQTIRKWVREGIFPPGMRLGKKVVWPGDIVALYAEKIKDRYIEENCK